MALTDVVVRKAEVRAKPYRISDSRGLYIEIHPNGSKYWRLKYRYYGKEKRLAIGVYPNVSLKQARLATDDAKKQLELDVDPSLAKRIKKVERQVAIDNDLESIAREWHQRQAKTWSEGYSNKVLRSLEHNLFPFLGSHPISDITPPQLLTVFRKVESRGAVESAHRLKQTTGQIYRYAVATGRTERDLTQDLKGAIATPKKHHFPAVTDPEKVGKLLRMIDGYEGTSTVRAAMKLAPLVFVRPKELRCAEWAEVNFEAAEWRIPGNKMKMKEDHIVPLSDQAIEILKDQQCLTGQRQYVFPSARSPRRPMSDNAILSAFRNMGISKDEMTGHGFRAMARTLLDEVLEERVDYIEHQLAHEVKDALGRAYNRTKHLPQRKAMMQRWANYLDELKAQSKLG